MIEESIPAALGGERIDRCVSMITGCTRNQAAPLVNAGKVSKNGRVVVKVSDRLAEDDVVVIDEALLDEVAVLVADPTIDIDVVHEDASVVVVNKPAGLVVHPGAGTADGTLANALLARYPDIAGVGEAGRPGIVHRLDKGTTGLLMVARNKEALESLSQQLTSRTVERRYTAVVWGHMESDQGLIDAAIGRSKRQPTRMAVVGDGRPARTRYAVESRHSEPAELTVVSCQLETGRTHQIRVHCKAIGHPVVGDEAYGGVRDGVVFARPALHAAMVGFVHPDTGQDMVFEVGPPADLQELLDSLD
jgi:23S rRNA pseudouridine1911/1915/1917 synthase